MNCPKCNAEIPAGKNFCVECGEHLPKKKRVRKCSKCGAEIPDGKNFCVECGEHLPKKKRVRKCAECNAVIPKGENVCTECGAAIPGVCAGCGAAIPEGETYCDECGETCRARFLDEIGVTGKILLVVIGIALGCGGIFMLTHFTGGWDVFYGLVFILTSIAMLVILVGKGRNLEGL